MFQQSSNFKSSSFYIKLFSVQSSETAKLPLIHCNFHRTVLVVTIESPSWVLTSNWLLQVRLLNLINRNETFFNNLFSFPFAGTNDPVLTVIKFLVNLSSLCSLFGSLWNNNNSRVCFKLKCHFYSGHWKEKGSGPGHYDKEWILSLLLLFRLGTERITAKK